MSEIQSVLSLVIKFNGLHFEKLAVDIAEKLQDEVDKISPASWPDLVEKLQILSMFIRESLEKDACGDVPATICLRDIVNKLWDPVFEMLISNSSDHHMVDFLTLVILYCHRHGERQALVAKLDHLVNTVQEDHGNNKGNGGPQSALLVIENILRYASDSDGILPVQKEVILRLVKLIGAFSNMDIKNTICLRVVGILLKNIILLPFDQELFDTLWKEIEMKLLGMIDRVLNANVHDYCPLLQHSLLLLDLLLELSVSKKDDSLWQDFLVVKISALLTYPGPWIIIQYGLQCGNAPLRKQALFNLRQALFVVGDNNLNINCYSRENELDRTALFFCSDDSKDMIMTFWKTFLLLVETLEENQLHVISPVLKNFDTLVARTHTNQFLIHTSWICVLLHRMMQHESKAIAREGIIMCLKLDPKSCPFLTQFCGTDLLHGKNGVGVIPSLQEVNLYCDFKDPSVTTYAEGKLPVIAALTKHFLINCFSAHPTLSKFLKFLLSSLNMVSWSAIPLYYFCHAMHNIPEYECWDGNDLNEFKSVVLKCLRTHDIRLRHAILELLLQCLMKFTKCCECNSDDILTIILYAYDAKDFLPTCPKIFMTIFSWMSERFQYFQNINDQDWQGVVHYACQKISHSCGQATISSLDDEWKTSRHNVAIALIAEESIMQNDERENLLSQLVLMLNEVLEKGSTYIYMPRGKVCKAIIMLNCLVMSWNRYPHKNGRTNVCNAVLKTLQSLQSYTQMRCSLNPECMEDVQLFLETWEILALFLYQTVPDGPWRKHIFEGFFPLLLAMQNISSMVCSSSDIKTLKQLKVITSSFMVLDSLCSLSLKFKIKPDQRLLLQLRDTLSYFDLGARKVSHEIRGDATVRDVIVKYSLHQWSCLPFLLQLSKEFQTLDHATCLNAFISSLDQTTDCEVSCYFSALGALLQNAHENLDTTDQLICECLDLSWKAVQTLTHSPSFWSVYASFVSAIFQPNVLSLPPTSKIQKTLQKILEHIVEVASLKPNMLLSVCKTFITSLKQLSQKDNHVDPRVVNGNSTSDASIIFDCAPKFGQLEVHSDFIFQCIVFNYVPKKEDVALHHVLKLRGLESKENTDYSKSRSWHVVSISMVCLLLQLDPKLQQNCLFVISIVKQLMNLDIEISMKKSRYHQGSFLHHVKNSIHQAILVLIPYVTVDTDKKSLVEHLMVQLKNDAQPSVRYLMEWSLAIFISRRQDFEGLLLNQLTNGESVCESGGSAKFSAICSYLSVALFVGMSKDNESQKQYLLRLVDICWPWCMSQHFSIRLYALAVLLRVKIHFEEREKSDVITQKYPSLATCMAFAECATGNVKKNWDKMKDNFFLFDFHPIRDYSLETAYILLPRLCGMQSYPHQNDFPHTSISSRKHAQFISGLDLWNRHEKLRNKETCKWIPQEPKTHCDHTVDQSERYRRNYGSKELTDNLEINSVVDNVQKKIMPWLDKAESAAKDSPVHRPPGLVLVASLIDKPSNLGGLTRTCEIFGAEAIVVQSSSCTNDKLYQSLSVTAHQWLPMKEIKPWKLEEYLMNMRTEGYTLIGIEQTAQSVCLTKYRFPQKCILLLGNEKEGIPITLLKVLDVCVQIPQKGIVRSLNVHVSGAIAIWEYTRQQLALE